MNTFMNYRFFFRSSFLLAILFLFLAGGGQASAQGCTGVSTSTTGAVTWTPQWCQEFTANTVTSPDTSVWKFDLGNNNGWGNNEVEVYCGPPTYPNNPNPCPNMISPTTNTVYLDGNGHLVIHPININGTWISTRMLTEGIKNFQYGRIEASLQLPDTTNPGLWPAFWSLGSSIATGTPWPTCGEADFMEDWSPQVLGGPGTGGNRATIHTTITAGSGTGGSYTFPSGMAANTAYHAYGVIWSPNIMQFYVDDATHPFVIKTPSDLPSGDTWPFNAQMFLLMNVAVGGTLGGSTSTLVNPQPLMADYVRQYSPSAVPKPTLGNPASITIKAGATTGNSTTLMLGLTPGTGFVYLSCTTTAPKASCSVATNDPLNTHVLNSSPAGAAETATVTVTTTANSLVPPSFFDLRRLLRFPVVIIALVLLVLIATLALRLRRRASSLVFATAALLILAGITIAGCGGGSSVAPPPPPPNGTTPGSYTVTVYAFTESNTMDGSNGTADASVPITLTVN
jgi:beta-glucanase (GH16 family)